MEKKKDEKQASSQGFARFSQLGQSLRQSVQDVAQKTAAQVNDLNAKVNEQIHMRDGGGGSAAAASNGANSNPSAPGTTPAKISEYSREQLIDVLQKMNKKVKVLNAKQEQLQKSTDMALEEKERLIQLVKDEILNGDVQMKGNQDPVLQLQAAWRKIDEQNALNLSNLQAEFARLQTQNGDSWEKEKRQLEELHEQQMLQLKESLMKMNQQDGGDEQLAEKVKQAADARVNALKKKFAQAHKTEVEKVKAQLKEEHQKDLESKLQELKEQVNVTQEIEAIRKELMEAHAQQLEQTRQEVEQHVTTEMEEKLQELLGEKEREYQAKIEQIRQDAADEVADQSSSDEFQKTIALKDAEIKNLRTALETAETAVAARGLAEETSAKKERETITQLEASLAKSTEDASQYKARVEEMETMFSQKVEEAQALSSELQRAKQEVQVVRSQNSEEHEISKKKVEELSAELVASRRQLESAASDARILQAKMSETEQTLNQKLKDESQRAMDAESRLAELVEERKSRESLVLKLQDEIETVREDLSSAKNAETSSKSLFSEKEENLRREISSLTERLASETAVLEKNVRNLEASLAQKADELETVKNEHEKKIVEIAENAENRIKKARDDVKGEVEAVVSELSRTKTLHEDRIGTLESELEISRESLKRYQTELDAKRGDDATEVRNAREDAQRALEANQNLQVEHKNALAELTRNLTDEANKKLEERIGIHFEEWKIEKAGEIEHIKSSHVSEINKWTERCSQLEEESSRYQSSFEDAQKKLSFLEDEFQSLKSKLEDELSGSKELVSQLQRDKKELEDRIASFESQGSEEITRLHEEIDRLSSEKSQLEQERDEKIASVTSSFENKVNDLLDTIKKVEAEKLNLSQSLTELDAKSEEVLELRSRLDAAAKSELEIKNEYEGKLKELSEATSREQERLLLQMEDAKRTGHEELGKEISSLGQKLEEAKSRVSFLENLVQSQKEEFSNQTSELMESHKNAISDLEIQRDELLKKNESLESNGEDSAAAQLEIESLREKLSIATKSLENKESEMESALKDQEARFETEKAALQKSLADHVDNMNAKFRAKLEETRKTTEDRVKELNEEKTKADEKLSQLLERLKAFNATTSKLKRENQEMSEQLKQEKSSVERLMQEIQKIRQEYDQAQSSTSETTSELLQQQELLEREKASLTKQLQSVSDQRDALRNQLDELKGKVLALSTNLNSLSKEKEEQAAKLNELSLVEKRLGASVEESNELREELTKVKLELSKNINIVGQLQTEKEANERNQGQRTAIVAMLENQLVEANEKNTELNAKLEAAKYDMSQKDESIEIAEDQLRKAKADLDGALRDLSKTRESLSSAQKGADAKSSKMIESLQKELQSLKQQMVKKSSAAQKLLQQRESECAELRSKNNALQQEVDKGSFSDRRIFELAAKQSNRESQQTTEIEMRDAIIDKLRHNLLERDDKLASSEKEFKELENQVEELYRVKRRNNVDVDYLKGVVVKYLSLPPGTDERARLLPVLATLLQFDSSDYKTIEEGKKKVSWFGYVSPTYITGPAGASESTPATQSSPRTRSAEVAVSSPKAQPKGDNREGTSLQF